MFKVKATVVGFLGEEAKYPCHFQHKIGDEFVYDGELERAKDRLAKLKRVEKNLQSLAIEEEISTEDFR